MSEGLRLRPLNHERLGYEESLTEMKSTCYIHTVPTSVRRRHLPKDGYILYLSFLVQKWARKHHVDDYIYSAAVNNNSSFSFENYN